MHNKQKFSKLQLNKKTITLLSEGAIRLQTGKDNSFIPIADSNKYSCGAPDCHGSPRTTKPTDTSILFCETI
jgi:hypothetical protein